MKLPHVQRVVLPPTVTSAQQPLSRLWSFRRCPQFLHFSKWPGALLTFAVSCVRPSQTFGALQCGTAKFAIGRARRNAQACHSIVIIVVLPSRQVLHRGGDSPAFVYFLNDGLVSLVIESIDGKSAEIGIIGRDGIAGTPTANTLPHNPVTEMMQIAGDGYRTSAATMAHIMEENKEVNELVIQYEALLAMRVAQIAGCNALHTAEQRLARWLLMANDRVPKNPLPLTHEFLGLLLGISRPSVSETLSGLRQKGAISLRRESVQISNRKRLERCSCDCYRVIASLEFRRT
jgi:CRP-like cAMP-binding protein